MGNRQHPGGHLGSDAAEGDLRHYGLSHGGTFLRWWDFEQDDAENRNPGAIGYGKGVPMGGDLTAAPAGKAPTFLVAALKARSAPISIGTRSSRVGSTTRALPMNKSMT